MSHSVHLCLVQCFHPSTCFLSFYFFFFSFTCKHTHKQRTKIADSTRNKFIYLSASFDSGEEMRVPVSCFFEAQPEKLAREFGWGQFNALQERVLRKCVPGATIVWKWMHLRADCVHHRVEFSFPCEVNIPVDELPDYVEQMLCTPEDTNMQSFHVALLYQRKLVQAQAAQLHQQDILQEAGSDHSFANLESILNRKLESFNATQSDLVRQPRLISHNLNLMLTNISQEDVLESDSELDSKPIGSDMVCSFSLRLVFLCTFTIILEIFFF